ncbi:polysaccharide deacetylase family protein [Clostridium sp.]|uniref:polysaccharide deacetylase family protein n=1 Tax=Clostridium sp. TaxID=1506 RepID=UPI0025C0372F|nr:polysaccharide deacetylase family protein [Clostridium sp.]
MSRRLIKNKKRFITFIFVLMVSVFLISFTVSDFKESIITQAETVTSNTNTNSNDNNSNQDKLSSSNDKQDNIGDEDEFTEETPNNPDTSVLDNSGYLSLEEDSNADDASKVLPETMYKWNFYREDNKKIAYLTFDDGPSQNSTEKILDILGANDIKATFFTLGRSIENNSQSEKLLKRMAKEGHSIASHGYSHDYSILYPNRTVDVDSFMKDFEKNDKILKEVLGKDFSTRLIRMPGGHASWNGTEHLDEVLESKGIFQMDWNALNGDAEGMDFPKEHLLNKLKETVGSQDVIIVLMHDTDAKKGTVEYLQSAIDYLKSEGFEFRTLK